jgi:hypothetical protein
MKLIEGRIGRFLDKLRPMVGYAGVLRPHLGSTANPGATRPDARSASVEVSHAMGLEYDAFGDVSAYRLPVLVMRLDPVNG